MYLIVNVLVPWTSPRIACGDFDKLQYGYVVASFTAAENRLFRFVECARHRLIRPPLHNVQDDR